MPKGSWHGAQVKGSNTDSATVRVAAIQFGSAMSHGLLVAWLQFLNSPAGAGLGTGLRNTDEVAPLPAPTRLTAAADSGDSGVG